MPINAAVFFETVHGKNCSFLSKDAIIDFAEKYYSKKLQEIYLPNDTYSEKRNPYPSGNDLSLPIQDLP